MGPLRTVDIYETFTKTPAVPGEMLQWTRQRQGARDEKRA